MILHISEAPKWALKLIKPTGTIFRNSFVEIGFAPLGFKEEKKKFSGR